MKRAVLICPGRGTYNAPELGSLTRDFPDAERLARFDAMRQDADSEAVAEVAIAARDLGVVGFDLAGPEAGNPARDHRAACERAREAGLGLTIHAGEGAGPESVADAVAVGAPVEIHVEGDRSGSANPARSKTK